MTCWMRGPSSAANCAGIGALLFDQLLRLLVAAEIDGATHAQAETRHDQQRHRETARERLTRHKPEHDRADQADDPCGQNPERFGFLAGEVPAHDLLEIHTRSLDSGDRVRRDALGPWHGLLDLGREAEQRRLVANA